VQSRLKVVDGIESVVGYRNFVEVSVNEVAVADVELLVVARGAGDVFLCNVYTSQVNLKLEESSNSSHRASDATANVQYTILVRFQGVPGSWNAKLSGDVMFVANYRGSERFVFVARREMKGLAPPVLVKLRDQVVKHLSGLRVVIPPCVFGVGMLHVITLERRDRVF